MDNKNDLINQKPLKRKKGFLNENINLDNFTNKDIDYIIKKINFVKNNINLSDDVKNIINKYLISYKNIKEGKNVKNKNIILTKHENFEIKKISDDNIARYLIYRYKFNVYPKIKKVDLFPPCVQIEPSSMCNYRCIMCYQIDKSFSSKSKGFAGHMSLELFKKIIDQLVGNVEAVTLASRGEPTLNPKFSQMIDYANDKFLALKLNTNASMLNEKLIHRLLSSNIQTIVFSIDSKDKESYEAIRVNGKFDNIIKKLELFNKIREKNYKREDKIVRISGVKINDKQDINEMKKKWGDIADIVAFTNYVPWESSYENEINNIIEPCTEFWSRMFIWHDGKVNPCDFDYKSKLSKWNVKEDSIKNIWNSDEYNHLRYCHLNNLRSELEPCRRCINI